MAASRNRFGQVLSECLVSRGLTQSALAARMDVSSAYVSATTTGTKSVSPERIENIVSALDLPAETAARLHRAAALDRGFRIDIPDDF